MNTCASLMSVTTIESECSCTCSIRQAVRLIALQRDMNNKLCFFKFKTSFWCICWCISSLWACLTTCDFQYTNRKCWRRLAQADIGMSDIKVWRIVMYVDVDISLSVIMVAIIITRYDCHASLYLWYKKIVMIDMLPRCSRDCPGAHVTMSSAWLPMCSHDNELSMTM